MAEFSDMEPIVAKLHEKGPGRGVAIYFGLRQVEELVKFGLDLREEQNYLVRTTINNNLILTPFFNLDKKERDDFLEIEEKVEAVLDLKKEDLEDFAEELLNIIIGKHVDLKDKERSALMQFIKGHYSNFIIRNAIRVGFRANRIATQHLLNEYIKNKGEGFRKPNY